MVALASCEESNILPGVDKPLDGVSNDLHLYFKTPDWERKIDCTHLDLPSYDLSEDVYFTKATSASTNNTFVFSFPADSSKMNAKENLKKYPIPEYGGNTGPFEFSFKVPVESGSSTNLYSLAGFSEKYFNEVVSITYLSSSENEAVFQVKCKYQLSASEYGQTTNTKDISGTYNFKVRTSRN